MTIKSRKQKNSNTIKGRELMQPVDYDKLNPVFSFYKIQDGYSINDCEINEKVSLLTKISKISMHSWIELKSLDKHGEGCEVLKNLGSLKCSIPSTVPQDATLIIFRFHDTKPMIGYREKSIFHIIWLDRKLSLYKH